MVTRSLATAVAILLATAIPLQAQTVPPPVAPYWLDTSASPPVWRQTGKSFPQPVTATQSTITTATITVASGQSLSPALDLGAPSLVGIQTPAAMDSATSLTFQVSYDNSTFQNFYDQAGNEYTLTVSTSRSVIMPYADLIGVRAIKLRLGTSGSPVVAGSNRSFTLALRP